MVANECLNADNLVCDDSIIDWALFDWLVGGVPSHLLAASMTLPTTPHVSIANDAIACTNGTPEGKGVVVADCHALGMVAAYTPLSDMVCVRTLF